MLKKRKEHHLNTHDLLGFRLWTAFGASIMQGLEHALPQFSTADEFLKEYQYAGPRDQENQGNGFAPILAAALSGSIAVVRELLSSHDADVNTRLVSDLPEFGQEQGQDALSLAVAGCPQDRIHGVVTILLRSGANPNSVSRSGLTPLISAVTFKNLDGVQALIRKAGKMLDMEQGLTPSGVTALYVASSSSTLKIVEALLKAGANRAHV